MESVNLFVVKSKISKGVNTMLFNAGTSLDEAKKLYPVLNDREIISAKNEACEVIPYGKAGKKFQVAYTDDVVNENGLLIGQTSYANPNDDAMMEITNRDIAEAEGNEEMEDFYSKIDKEDA